MKPGTTKYPLSFDKETLCKLIPHSGNMCLLDAVEYWDTTSIRCRAGDIHHPNHPLRHQGSISSLAALELGAQAMAVHGGILANTEKLPITPGYLAAIRHANIGLFDLSGITEPLIIQATRLMGDQNAQLYKFNISASGQSLVSAKATVLSSKFS